MNSDWLPAFGAVDRAWFLPDVMWPYDMATQGTTTVDKAADPEGWHRYADANVPITTQWDDGEHTGPEPGKVPTSSSSMPSVVFSMLQDLDVSRGMKVLEIGTGTGWNAGLLAHRLGNGQVTTIEVDHDVATRARKALYGMGLNPTVASADGLFGYPPEAPFDRVLATCGMRSIPFSWVRQTVPGGLIVVPWGTHWANRDTVVRLTVADGNSSASGRFTTPVEFMKLRTQRLGVRNHAHYVIDDFPGGASVSTTTLTARDGFDDRFSPFGFAAGLRIPQCTHATDARGDARSVWLYSLSDRSWAAVVFQEGKPVSTVYQSGARRLWDEVEATYLWWVTQGKPSFEQFGLTITPEGQTVWLDDPANSWPV